jgi:diguanylate cyclase (GGDEF)-like protein
MERNTGDWFDHTLQDSYQGGGDAPSNPIPYLLVLHGEDRGKRHPLRKGITTLGRESDADIVINDSRISRVHCAFEVSRAGVTVADAGSRNGTFVNDVRITDPSPVHVDTRIRIGRTLLKVTHKAEEEIRIEEEMFREATTDSLTGLPNRRWFFEQAGTALAHAKRHGPPLSLLVLDLDHFKRVNDTYGHAAGDAVLVETAALVREVKRQDDLLCRYGGEEFLLILQGTSRPNAVTFAERLRERLAAHAVRTGRGTLRVTASIGVAELRKDDTLESLFKRADKALYRAKEGGRNRVACERT